MNELLYFSVRPRLFTVTPAIILLLLASEFKSKGQNLCLRNSEKSQEIPKCFYEYGVMTYGVHNEAMNNELKILYYKNNISVIGGRNKLYRINMDTLKEETIEWVPNDVYYKVCRANKRSEDKCQNYLKIYGKIFDNDDFLVCGTNAYLPSCRQYLSKNGEIKINAEFPAKGFCSQNPYLSSASVVLDGIYSASFEMKDDYTYPVISKREIYSGTIIKTILKNKDMLNAVNFIDSTFFFPYIFFFFREKVNENTVYSKVARVCFNDRGYENHENTKHWTTFFKSRLICSLENRISLNNIRAVSHVVGGKDDGNGKFLIYAIFNFNLNKIRGSAVCVYSMDSIAKSFEGDFKDPYSSKAVPAEDIPVPRPGKCDNYEDVSNETAEFLSTHFEMNDPIAPFTARPILVESKKNCSYTSIFVDPQVKAINNKRYNILYITTECGTVIKARNDLDTNFSPIIETIQVSNPSVVLQQSYIYGESLLAISKKEIFAVQLHRCKIRGDSCFTCVLLKDPYCAWDKNLKYCRNVDFKQMETERFIQNIETGTDIRCDDIDKSLTRKPPSEKTSQKDCSGTTSLFLFQQYNFILFSTVVISSFISQLNFYIRYFYE